MLCSIDLEIDASKLLDVRLFPRFLSVKYVWIQSPIRNDTILRKGLTLELPMKMYDIYSKDIQAQSIIQEKVNNAINIF